MLLAGISVYRLSLIDRGHFFWGDEQRYLKALDAVNHWFAGRAGAGVACMFEALGRPCFVLISTLPAVVQRGVASWLGMDMLSPAAFHVVGVFNVAISICLAWCVYALALRWMPSRGYALLALLAYSLLAASNVWVRHLMPYHQSLLLFLWGLYLVSRLEAASVHPVERRGEKGTSKRAHSRSSLAAYEGTAPGRESQEFSKSGCGFPLPYGRLPVRVRTPSGGSVATGSCRGNRTISWAVCVGTCSALGFATYPSYYPFVLINLCAIVVVSRRCVTAAAGFGLGALGALCLFEMLARMGDSSYLDDMLTAMMLHAGQRSHGYFSEGFAFALHYMRDVEGPAGVFLLALFGSLAIGVLWRPAAPMPRSARAALLAAVACYLLHASASVLFHKTIFLGRMFAMYLPLTAIGAALALSQVTARRLRFAAVGLMVSASIASFVPFAIRYARLTYPADFLFATLSDLEQHRTAPGPGAFIREPNDLNPEPRASARADARTSLPRLAPEHRHNDPISDPQAKKPSLPDATNGTLFTGSKAPLLHGRLPVRARAQTGGSVLSDAVRIRNGKALFGTPPAHALWGKPGGRLDSVEELLPELALVCDARPEGMESPLVPLQSHERVLRARPLLIGVNLKWVFYHRQRDTRFKPPSGYRLLARAEHPFSMPAICYEDFKPWERRRLMNRRYQMRIYLREEEMPACSSDTMRRFAASGTRGATDPF